MYVITESEYKEAVEEVAALVFDPMHGDGDTSAFSCGFLDRLEAADHEGTQELVDELRERTRKRVDFDHPWGEYERSIGFDSLPPSMCGMIIEHGDSLVDNRFREDPHSYNTRIQVQQDAFAVFATDVYDKAAESVKAAKDDSDA